MEENLENVVEDLKEKAAEDLDGATKIQYGNKAEDVEIVNNVRAKFEQMTESLTKGRDEYFKKTKENLEKFKDLANYFKSSIDSNAATNKKLSDLLTEQLNSVKKAIEELEKSLADYDYKTEVIETVIKHLTFKVKEDGKCYVEQYAIDFAKLLLA